MDFFVRCPTSLCNQPLFKDVISGQLDADRADYLLRDSIHTGVNYGLYDRNRLINCIDIG